MLFADSDGLHEPIGELQSAARGGGELPTLHCNVVFFFISARDYEINAIFVPNADDRHSGPLPPPYKAVR